MRRPHGSIGERSPQLRRDFATLGGVIQCSLEHACFRQENQWHQENHTQVDHKRGKQPVDGRSLKRPQEWPILGQRREDAQEQHEH
jgi:hypothetical protein